MYLSRTLVASWSSSGQYSLTFMIGTSLIVLVFSGCVYFIYVH